MDRFKQQCEDVASAIGDRIAQDAFWHEDRCNWVGAQPSQSLQRAGVGTTYQTLGPDLYSGTSGVALFLAELAATNSAAVIRETALGAIRQALSRYVDVHQQARLGLFSGWLGIVLAAVRISTILDAPAIRVEALSLLRRCLDEGAETDEFDLMSGHAGAIAALLALHRMLGDDALLESAERLGRELVQRAARSDSGWSWQAPGWTNLRNLTGLSHGTAGCGFALTELFQATGERLFQNAAQNAFRYERTFFNPAAGNWPDFRKNTSSRSRKKSAQCLSFWCHGAPGIAMTRLRACETLNDDTCREEAAIAVRTTAESIVAAVEGWTGNFSMCHGLAGNGEVLLYASQVLGPDEGTQALLERTAAYGMERCAAAKAPWPCGTHSGETPNLMLGTAGIGQFYLRLAKPSLPSVLLLRKEAWA
jgi:lantibiotic biosynthesis protein